MSISRKVKKVLKKFPYDISFVVDEGIVLLEGEVNSHQEWVKIGLNIGDIKGVKGVVNEIRWKGMKEGKTRAERRENIASKNERKRLGKHEVVIIGGGIIGCSIARELSKFKVDVALVEKGPDVSLGQTRANNGMVHPGLAPSKGSLKRRLNVRGNEMYGELCEELDVPFKRVGSLILITSRTLKKYKRYLPLGLNTGFCKYILPWLVKKKADRNRLKGVEILRGDDIKKEVKGVTDDVISAVKIPSTGIVDPYELTIALYENAKKNGVDFYLDTEVVGFAKEDSMIRGVITDKGVLGAHHVVNAAGLYSDEIAELADTKEFTIHPRKGVELLFNKRIQDDVEHCLTELTLPSHPTSKGGGINPTGHGNIIWGPTAKEIESKKDTSVDKKDIDEIMERYSKVLPDFPRSEFIRYFAGVRAPSFTEDFIIRPAKEVQNLLHVAAIQPPGIASAPAIAEYSVEMLDKMGLKLERDESFDGSRRAMDRAAEMSDDELRSRIQEEQRWGNIVCTCEMVSEAEIIEAINRGAESFDAIKRRTRAGMGEGQESYCLLRIADIMSKELDIPLKNVKKEWAESEFFDGTVRGEEG